MLVSHRVLCLVISLTPLLWPICSSARILTQKHEKLAGVSAFELEIVPLNKEAKAAGLSESDLRFLIEANLRRANLPLRQNTHKALPYLLADAKITCSGDLPACGFLLTLRFDDVVQLRGNTAYAEVWQWASFGIAAPDDVAVAVLAELRDRGMPNFVRDYLWANP